MGHVAPIVTLGSPGESHDNHDNKGPRQQRQPKRTPFSASNNNTKRGHSQHKDNASGFHVASRDSLTALINDAVQIALANKK